MKKYFATASILTVHYAYVIYTVKQERLIPLVAYK